MLGAVDMDGSSEAGKVTLTVTGGRVILASTVGGTRLLVVTFVYGVCAVAGQRHSGILVFCF